MRIQIKKSSRGASLHVPASILAAASLSVDQTVDVRPEGGRIVIEPVASPIYELDEVLASMDPETFPEDVDFGREVGREAWPG